MTLEALADSCSHPVTSAGIGIEIDYSCGWRRGLRHYRGYGVGFFLTTGTCKFVKRKLRQTEFSFVFYTTTFYKVHSLLT